MRTGTHDREVTSGLAAVPPRAARRRALRIAASVFGAVAGVFLGLACCHGPEPCNQPPCSDVDGGLDGGARCPQKADLAACAGAACDVKTHVCLVAAGVACAFKSEAFVPAGAYAAEWRPHHEEWQRLLDEIGDPDSAVGLAAVKLQAPLRSMDKGTEQDRLDAAAREQVNERIAALVQASGATCR